jgi:hypothetical protein
VVTESRINLSFAGVAIRVAVTKLKNLKSVSAQEPGRAPVSPGGSMSSLGNSPLPGSRSNLEQSQSGLASTGLSWSGVSGSSSMSASGVSVTDAASAAFLTVCTKALARSLGPMAKAFVKDAIRSLLPGRAFSLDLGPLLCAELEKHIEDPADRIQFRNAVKAA